MNKKGPSTFCICIQADGEEEEEEAAECRWFFLLPGSYLISVRVCGKKSCWDLGKRGKNQDQQGQGSPALGPVAVLVGWGCRRLCCIFVTCLAISSPTHGQCETGPRSLLWTPALPQGRAGVASYCPAGFGMPPHAERNSQKLWP